MHHRNAILPPPPARDTVPCDAPDDGEPAESGRYVIDPDRAATMRAEWAALTDLCPPAWESILDGEADPFTTTYPGSLS
jgi:hypothetical protein